MAGFIRRLGFFPGTEIIKAIEGVVIVDLPPPGSINGVGTGTTAIVGEFVNMQFAVSVDSSGVATTNPQPVEVFSAQDLINKVGGFDELLGKFGADMGNGFVELRNKKFSRLILQTVDLITPAAGSQGTIRLWRDLPTNQSATVAQPIVPISAAAVVAGREFKNGSSRVRTAAQVVFTDDIAYNAAIDGAVTALGSTAATQPFNATLGLFTTVVRNDGSTGVKEGDILVVGVLSGAGALGANAGTYRVVSVTDADTIVVEKMDGTVFDWTTTTALPWRLHMGRAADSSGDLLHQLSEAAGYSVLARPLDATLTVGLALTPTVVPSAGSAVSWNALSGLTGKVHPSTALTYDANVHAPNVSTNAALEARYQAAIDATVSDDYPARDINIITSARKSSVIRTKLKTHVIAASERGLTRRTMLSPPVNQLTLATVLGDADPGVGANRDERIDFSWPALRTSIPEAVGFSIATSDGKTTLDGVLDVTSDTWLAAVESNLAPERNPGQAAPPVPGVLAPVLAFARGTPKLGQPEYTAMKSRGICAPRFDRTVGPIFQSGVTTSLISGQQNIFRRRMADFIQDSISQRIVVFSKLPMTDQMKDSVVAEIIAFLNELLSPNNPSAKRIDDYIIDDKSGNTPQLEAQGIFVVIVKVRLNPTMDYIVLQTEIGEGVVTTQEAA